MKKWLKWTGMGVGAIAIVPVTGVTWATVTWPVKYPDTPKPNLQASQDPAVIAQGKYLFDHVAHCSSCHAKAPDIKAAQPGRMPVPAGGYEWHMGPLGTLRSTNLTVYGEGSDSGYTDADLARIIRSAVRADGSVAPFMHAVGPMADRDIVAIVSYMRSLKPVQTETYQDNLSPIGKVLLRTVMSDLSKPKVRDVPTFVPPGGISIERGRYLASGPGNCMGCHTAPAPGTMMTPGDRPFAGDHNTFPDETDPPMVFVTPNLTPDPQTGHIAGWSEEQFVARLRGGRVYAGSHMPWEAYRGMTDEDVRSVYRFLKSLPPVAHDVGPIRRAKDRKPNSAT